jgi:arylsulfatase
VDIPPDGADGVLLSLGGNDGGCSFFVKEGRLQYVQNYVAREYLRVEAQERVPEGRHDLRFEFEVTGPPDPAAGKGSPGRAQLYVDGRLSAETEFAFTTPFSMGLTGGWSVGADPGAPVAPLYDPPFAFTGTLHHVTVDVSGEVIKDEEAEFRMHMARQ